ncbi:MAG TPA: ABC transporter permease [Bacteroidales bacterium]|nr:ABC transporter permease [Bacteroidales bacterium]HOE04152.1 ABC transporter permease [Bacteroidales bacterium]
MGVYNRVSIFHLFLWLLGALVLLFIAAPLLGMFFATGKHEFFHTISDKEVTRSIGLTLWTSMAATLIFAAAAVPFAWLLARKKFRFKGLVNAIIDIPIVIPHSAAGIAVLGFISRDTMLGRLGESIGISFVSNPAGIVVAMAFVSLPFLINAARDGFAAVPEKYEKAALNLGASPARVFFTISLPLAWRSIMSGFIMMFARGMSEFGAVVIVAYHPMITPVMIYERFGAFGLAYARPVAVVFILVCLVFFALLRYLSNKSTE